jgi:hypothetical protein
LYFANGVALSAREDFVVVAATYSAQLHRYWLKGPKAGTLEKFADLGGAPDGLSRGPDGSFWVAIPAQLPDVFVSATKSRLVRRLFAMLPEALLPAPVKMGMVAQLSPDGKVGTSAGERPSSMEDGVWNVLLSTPCRSLGAFAGPCPLACGVECGMARGMGRRYCACCKIQRERRCTW